MTKLQATLINYFDVWGNQEDGYEVNNLCKEGTVELNEDFTNADLLLELQDVGFLNEHATVEKVEFEDLGDFGVEFFVKETGCPIGRIEFIHN